MIQTETSQTCGLCNSPSVTNQCDECEKWVCIDCLYLSSNRCNECTGQRAKRYDNFRKQMPSVSPPNRLVLTQGVSSLGFINICKVFTIVRNYNDFSPDNDPYGEHDMGFFEFQGDRMLWKIDDYNGEEGLQLILTVMYAEEY